MPQLENGFLRIATEIFDALVFNRIPGEQMQCLLFILRKTYGFNKKWDAIALSQFVSATGIVKPHVCRALSALVARNIIVTKKGNRKLTSYSFNKTYKSWIALPKKVTLPKKVIAVTQKGNRVVPKKVTPSTKDNITINTITKDILSRAREFEINARKILNGKTNTSLLKTFIDYWTETHVSGKKLRFEEQKFFDVKKRYATFERRENKFGNQNKTYKEKGYESAF